jgi:hypothetical protein
MIQYSLRCCNGHSFDSWFQSASAFEKLNAAGLVSCAVCGAGDVTKAVMAPHVRTARSARAPDQGGPAEPAAAPGDRGQGPLSTPASPAEQALAELRKKIDKHSEYVGLSFAEEARAIHEGTAPNRPIYGEAAPDDARALIEDGVPVAPLPFLPGRKSN